MLEVINDIKIKVIEKKREIKITEELLEKLNKELKVLNDDKNRLEFNDIFPFH